MKVKHNLLLFFGVVALVILIVNSTKRILSFRENWQQVGQSEIRLEEVKKENEQLMRDYEYKKSQKFVEAEIRNKLGLAKENEAIVIVPQHDSGTKDQEIGQIKTNPNWKKWWKLFFGA